MKREDKIAGKIKGYLDRSAADLKPGVAYRLQQARAAAVARIGQPRRAAARETALAGAGRGTVGGKPLYTQARVWFAILLLAAAAFGYQQWRVVQQINENEEVDAQILSSDLPFDAYLDRGFQNWLKTSVADR